MESPNETYGTVAGFGSVDETGRTGWSTVYALTRALQHELGIVALANSFGPGTIAALSARADIGVSAAYSDIAKIVQGALYCKGYDPNGFDGYYGTDTAAAVRRLKVDMGFASTTSGTVISKVFKGLLTMDAYVLLLGGTAAIRAAQQWLNQKYLSRQNFFISPADGLYSRNVQRNLVYALQYEIGMTDSTANGTFGPGTQAGLQAQGNFSAGASDTTKNFVRLFHAALAFNRYSVPFNGTFDASDSSVTRGFQAFAALGASGSADYHTWASLLVSTGDPTRIGTACDGITEVTTPRAQTLVSQGYKYVGRYLSNAAGSTLNKRIQSGELTVLFANELRVYPIFQTNGGNVSYFSATRGRSDGIDAFNATSNYRFFRGTTIYFAVDFDATDDEIDSNILPHFRAVHSTMRDFGSKYKVGVYGSRNVCARVSAADYASSSFVSGMSTGFSGNLEYALPSNWAFDQISTRTIGTGTSAIQIDNNIASGRDIGQVGLDAAPAMTDVPTPISSIPNYPSFMQDYFWWFETNTTVLQQAVILHKPQDIFERIINDYDDLLTSLARGYRMRKSLIETILLWESSVENIGDPAKDIVVQATYNYLEMEEAWDALSATEKAIVPAPVPPLIQARDSSTGLGQIFAARAAEAIAWGRSRGMTDEPLYDITNWKSQRDLWTRLHVDPVFNIRICALFILWGASLKQIDVTNSLAWTDEQVKSVMAVYNGADSYGERNFGLYSFLETRLNGPARQ